MRFSCSFCLLLTEFFLSIRTEISVHFLPLYQILKTFTISFQRYFWSRSKFFKNFEDTRLQCMHVQAWCTHAHTWIELIVSSIVACISCDSVAVFRGSDPDCGKMWKELRYIIWQCRSEYDLSYYRIDAFVCSAVCKLVVYWAIVHPTVKLVLNVTVTKKIDPQGLPSTRYSLLLDQNPNSLTLACI